MSRSLFLLLVGLTTVNLTSIARADDPTDGAVAHAELFESNAFPSARECSSCHPIQYKEWASSPHAYAQLSPVFNAMNAKLLKLTNGTLGDFCIRCHTPVGMALDEPIVAPNAERHAVSREGVTCVTCHRRSQPEGKSSGRFSIEHGDITAAVYGPQGGAELERVLASKEYELGSAAPERKVHSEIFQFEQLTTSGFCGTCHDVNGANGFRLEEAFSEFKSSPAASNSASCQDCHMGTEPGRVSDYAEMPAALVGGKPTRPRRHANHRFVGPDYSIVHAGVFPHNPAAEDFATFSEWIQFDIEAGWGTDDFEDLVTGEERFPSRWQSAAARYRARSIIEDNLDTLQKVAVERKQLLQNGYRLGAIEVVEATGDGIEFTVEVENATDGHNVPTGFDAERLVFLRVEVRDAMGDVLYRSGDLDPNGDLRDSHSRYVHDGVLPLDEDLFSLQSKFVVKMIRGGDREQVLNVNYSPSPLPFLRPPTHAALFAGRPRGTRKHRQTIPPKASRSATYRIDGELLLGRTPPYEATIQLIAGMVPVNLVHAIADVGFDYAMSPRTVADAVVAGHQVLWEQKVSLRPGASSE
ncbi:MAG: hypothetical protein KDD69_13795 [Bdellovibrionales bacterium]|nr:hypothetical protein [Bdellovibrionales bacterium]